MILVLLCLIATAVASPLPPAEAGDTWLQVCCQDNDLNSSGGINFREFTIFALNLMNLNRAELEKLFLTGDVDRNSELDGEECIPMRATLKKMLNEKGDILLKKYDVSNDGKLSQDEAISLAKSEFGVSKNETFKEFILADQNADHMVSSGNEMSELMLNLRTRQVINAGMNLPVGNAALPHTFCTTFSHNKAPVHTSSPIFTMPLCDALLTSVHQLTPNITADPFRFVVLTFRYHNAPQAPVDSLRCVVCILCVIVHCILQ
ncbi:hypothetical protein Y032_0218g2431 [Ancylostoma ceylanicum]|uniref:EF hand n=1 Tax=Ancylostoma ceylanicum TaxID=53326 RepID=A0A016SIT8_9BILA|nr:hypothetical protein Y032_0218g2431 [Ancylostoma ceylanicum]